MKKSKLIIFTAILVIVTSILLLTTRSLGVAKGVPNLISIVDNALSKPFNFLSEIKSDLVNLAHTYKENEQLKKSLYDMEEQSADLDSLKDENAQLRKLLDMQNLYSSKSKVTADVITRTPVSWLEELTVNAGKDNGVNEHMLAVANGGLIGRVEEVAANSSRINLLSNNEQADNISVRIQSGSEQIYGVIIGYDKDKGAFIVSKLNSSTTIKEGDKVVTSGLGTYNVANIPVGKVLSVSEKEDHLTKVVYIKPSADLSDIRAVTLVGN